MSEYLITPPAFRLRMVLSGVVLLLIYVSLAELKLLHLGIAEITKFEDFWDEITETKKFVINTLWPIAFQGYLQSFPLLILTAISREEAEWLQMIMIWSSCAVTIVGIGSTAMWI
jgi:hypothetical protein